MVPQVYPFINYQGGALETLPEKQSKKGEGMRAGDFR